MKSSFPAKLGLLPLLFTSCLPLQPAPPTSLVSPSPSATVSVMPSPTALPSPSPVEATPLPSPSSSASIPSATSEPTSRPTGYPVELVAGTGEKGFQDGPALQASFNAPQKPCYNPRTETLYIPDTHMLRKLTADGQVVTVAGGQEAGYKEGQGTEARFNLILACAVDAEGNVLLTDFNNFRIRQVSPAGQVTTFLGTGKSGLDDGPLSQATLMGPNDLAISPSGVLYLSEVFWVRKVDQGQLTTVNKEQTTTAPWYPDGPLEGRQGILGAILYLAADARDHLYFADIQAGTLRYLDGNRVLKRLSARSLDELEAFNRLKTSEERDLHMSAGPFTAVTYDPSRNVVYACAERTDIFRVEPDGNMRRIAGNYFASPNERLFTLVRGGLSMGKDNHLYAVDVIERQIKRVIFPPP